jgi:hypothetical protein
MPHDVFDSLPIPVYCHSSDQQPEPHVVFIILTSSYAARRDTIVVKQDAAVATKEIMAAEAIVRGC